MDIASIKHRALKRFVEKDSTRGLNADWVERIRDIITALVLAPDVDGIQATQGQHLHQLTGKRAGTWSMKVSGNWCITFEIDDDGDIVNLNLEDYH